MRAAAEVLAESVSDVHHRIEHRGFAVLRGRTERDFVRVACEMGQIVDDTIVRVVPGKVTYLASPASIPFHTDHPAADLVLWRCAQQDAHDGASLLLDGHAVLSALDRETLSALHRVWLPAAVRRGEPEVATPVVRQERYAHILFYAPWVAPIDRFPAARDALVALRDEIRFQAARATAVRLLPGDVLVVDNHRMLHGRDRLLPASTRLLRRLWIARC